MRNYGRRRNRSKSYTVDHFDRAGRFIGSEEIIARYPSDAEYRASQRHKEFGSSSWRVFDETLAVRYCTDDLHRALRAMSGGRVQPIPSED
jgi:hypothetical protein